MRFCIPFQFAYSQMYGNYMAIAFIFHSIFVVGNSLSFERAMSVYQFYCHRRCTRRIFIFIINCARNLRTLNVPDVLKLTLGNKKDTYLQFSDILFPMFGEGEHRNNDGKNSFQHIYMFSMSCNL